MKIDLSRKAEWSERDDLERVGGPLDLPRQLEIIIDWVGFLRQKKLLARHARWGKGISNDGLANVPGWGHRVVQGTWKGWLAIGLRSWAIECTDHDAAKGLTTRVS